MPNNCDYNRDRCPHLSIRSYPSQLEQKRSGIIIDVQMVEVIIIQGRGKRVFCIGVIALTTSCHVKTPLSQSLQKGGIIEPEIIFEYILPPVCIQNNIINIRSC